MQFERQILSLDKITLTIRERMGQPVSRAEVIWTILDPFPILKV
jgi:hypothetical protein